MTVNQFIDAHSKRWREFSLRQYFDPEDVKLILGVKLSRISHSDRWDWHYNKSGRYSVKSSYRLEEESTFDKGVCFVPNLEALQAHSWKVSCSGKIKNFMWQVISGCVAVKDKLKKREIKYDNLCARYGEEGETINHVLFKGHLAIQTWAFSVIPSSIHCFPGDSAWSNMDYLFWRISDQVNIKIYLWIL